jgi:tetratricopeptide (TPR) repeat protein
MEGFLGIHDRSVDSLYNQLEPRLRHENTLHAFKEIFKLLSLSTPIAIEIEDLQWIDADSTKAFQFICRNIESFPIIFVISSRYYDDESKPKLPVENPSLEIDLQVLSDEGTIEFAESLLDGKLSDKLKGNLLGKTEGNPFFVEQTVFFYRESDIIYFDSAPGHWEMKEDTKAIPDTINDLIIARIDRLSAKLKEAVQTASVFGQEFDINLLMEVLDKISQVWEEGDYQYFLKEGEDIKVWAILSQIKGIFAHAIMRDAVYNMQLRSRLRTLHQIVAETLKNLFPEDKRTYADLAFHYEQAGMREQTKEYLEKAAFYAKENFKNHESAKYFGKICQMYEEDLGLEEKKFPESQLSAKDKSKLEKYIDLQVYHGTVLSVLGQLTKANENFRFALNIAEAINDETRAGKLYLNLGSNSLYFGKFDQALSYFGKAKSIFVGNNDYENLAIVMGNIGLINLYQGNLGDAIENFQKELSLSQKASFKSQEVIAVGHMGNAYDLMGYYDNAIKYFKKQLDMSREIKNKFLEASALGDIGVAYYYKGDYEKAISYYEKQLKLNREIGNNLELSNAIGNMGLVYSDRGEFDKALECYDQKLYLSKELADKKEMSIVFNNMAEVYAQKGNYEKAIVLLDKAINIGKELNHDYFLSNFIVSKAEVLFEFGNLDEAEKVCEKGYKLGKKVNRKDVIFRAKVLLLKIDFVLHEKTESVRIISKFLDEISDKEDRAVLNYELYNMTKEQNYRNEALSLYQNLYEKTPKHVYQKRIKELKGNS